MRDTAKYLKDGAAQIGTELDDDKISVLCRYAELLKEWNERINLTAICDDFGIASKHFLDSLTALGTNLVGERVIDIGCGAGFPGLVLKIARPEIKLTLLDSLNKRVKFLRTVCDELGICDVELLHARAEEYAGKPEYRAQFDTVVSRAVANMRTLCEWCIPYVKIGGSFLALKGPLADSELCGARETIKIMGGEVADVFEASIPETDLRHKIICVRKVSETPSFFPRNAGLAAKSSAEDFYKRKRGTR